MANLPTPEDLAYMQAHIQDSTVADIIACCAVCAAASVIVVALRIWARFHVVTKLNVGDYLIIVSLVFFIAFCTVFALSTRYGAGRHIILIMKSPETMRMLAILNILNPILYGMAATFVKLSILALYVAIFPQKGFRLWVYILGVINILNAISIVLVSCLQCRPIQALWSPIPGATCINFSYFSMFNTSFNLVIDVVILLSPIPLVLNLNLSKRKRILLAINFALGGGACVVAAIRLPFARRVGGTVDPSWDMIAGGLLTVVEVAVALLCASLPVYRPLLKRFAPGLSSTAAASSYKNRTAGHSDYLGSGGGGGGVRTQVSTASKRGSARRQGISVTDDINMTAHVYSNGEWVRISDDEVDLFPKDVEFTSSGKRSLY